MKRKLISIILVLVTIFCLAPWTSAAVAVTSIKLNYSTLTISPNNTLQLTATVSPSNATNKTIKWTSSNSTAAVVSSSGLITAKTTGTTVITAAATDGSGKNTTCVVTVKSISVGNTSTFYRQDQPNFTITNLTKCFFPNVDSSLPLAAVSGYNKGIINYWGCVMCSCAMLLKNAGATTISTKYDLRSGTSGKLAADPFTAAMTNAGQLGSTVIKPDANGKYIFNSGDPVNASNYATVATAFGKTFKNVDVSSLTEEQKAATITYYIQQHPNGVVARIPGLGHSIVINKSTYPVASQLVTVSASQSQSIGIFSRRMQFNGQVFSVTEETITEANQERIWQEDNMPLSSLKNSFSIMAVNPTISGKFTACDPMSSSGNISLTSTWTYGKGYGIESIANIKYYV